MSGNHCIFSVRITEEQRAGIKAAQARLQAATPVRVSEADAHRWLLQRALDEVAADVRRASASASPEPVGTQEHYDAWVSSLDAEDLRWIIDEVGPHDLLRQAYREDHPEADEVDDADDAEQGDS